MSDNQEPKDPATDQNQTPQLMDWEKEATALASKNSELQAEIEKLKADVQAGLTSEKPKLTEAKAYIKVLETQLEELKLNAGPASQGDDLLNLDWKQVFLNGNKDEPLDQFIAKEFKGRTLVIGQRTHLTSSSGYVPATMRHQATALGNAVESIFENEPEIASQLKSQFAGTVDACPEIVTLMIITPSELPPPAEE